MNSILPASYFFAFYFLSLFLGRCVLVLSERCFDLLKKLGLAEFPLKIVAPAGLFPKVLAGDGFDNVKVFPSTLSSSLSAPYYLGRLAKCLL